MGTGLSTSLLKFIYICQPERQTHEFLAFIVSTFNQDQGSDEYPYLGSLVKAFAARIHYVGDVGGEHNFDLKAT